MYLHTTYWLVSYNEKTKWYQGSALILRYEILMTSRKKKQFQCKINGYILTTPIFFTCQCHGHTSSVNSAETPPIFDIEPFKKFFQIKMLQYVSISRKNWKMQPNFFSQDKNYLFFMNSPAASINVLKVKNFIVLSTTYLDILYYLLLSYNCHFYSFLWLHLSQLNMDHCIIFTS